MGKFNAIMLIMLSAILLVVAFPVVSKALPVPSWLTALSGVVVFVSFVEHIWKGRHQDTGGE